MQGYRIRTIPCNNVGMTLNPISRVLPNFAQTRASRCRFNSITTHTTS